MSRARIAVVLVGVVATGRAAAAAPVAPRCGTPAHLHELAQRPRPPSLALAGAKMLRDPFPAMQKLQTSTNFALRWQTATLDDAQAQQVLAAAESAWSLYVSELGQRVPTGSDAFLLDIYVSTATDTPSIDYGGGYATLDDEGYPYLVVSSELLASPTTLRHTVTHELYHCFQFSTGAFQIDPSYWYWEATAEWASQERAPDDADSYGLTGALSLATYLPLFYMGDPSGTTEDYVTGVHQYAASLFPRYLTDTRHDRSLVPRTWETGGTNDDALGTLIGLVEPDPDRAADLFAEFAAHAAVSDLPHADLVAASNAVFSQYFPERVGPAATVGPEGTGGFIRAAADHALGAYGFDVIELARPADGDLRVEVAADPHGSAGTPARLRATLVRSGGLYTPVPISNGTGIAQVQLPATESRAWLVVAAISTTRDIHETFPFQFRAGPDVPEPAQDDEMLHAGCRSTQHLPGSSLALVALALVAVRRRRRRA